MLENLNFFTTSRSTSESNIASISPKTYQILFNGPEIRKFITSGKFAIGIATDKDGNLILMDSKIYNFYSIRTNSNNTTTVSCKAVVNSLNLSDTVRLPYEVKTEQSEVEGADALTYIIIYLNKEKGD